MVGFFLLLQCVVGPALRRFWRCSFCVPAEDPSRKSLTRLLACTIGVRSPSLRSEDCAGRETCGLMPQPPTSRVMPATFMAVMLTVLFACAVATNALGVFSIFGAFLLGVALHQEVTLVKAWRERFRDFVLVALVPIFFTNTGLRTEVGSLATPAAWFGCGVVFVAGVAAKLGGCYLGARWTGSRRARPPAWRR